MKKICLSLMMMVTATAMAQRKCDMETTGGITGTTITIDPSGAAPTYYEVAFRNNGPDDIEVTDTIYFSSPFLDAGAIGYISPVNLPPGAYITISDIFYFKSGPEDGTYEFCDTLWVTSTVSDPSVDPVLPNNHNCRTLTVVNKTTAISDVFVDAGKDKAGSLNIMPNPATAAVSFDFVARNNTEVFADVYDLAGRKVMTRNYGYAYQGQSGYSLDIAALQPGLYFVTLGQEGVRMTGRLHKS